MGGKTVKYTSYEKNITLGITYALLFWFFACSKQKQCYS